MLTERLETRDLCLSIPFSTYTLVAYARRAWPIFAFTRNYATLGQIMFTLSTYMQSKNRHLASEDRLLCLPWRVRSEPSPLTTLLGNFWTATASLQGYHTVTNSVRKTGQSRVIEVTAC